MSFNQHNEKGNKAMNNKKIAMRKRKCGAQVWNFATVRGPEDVFLLAEQLGIPKRWATAQPGTLYHTELMRNTEFVERANYFLGQLKKVVKENKPRQAIILGDKDADGITSTAQAWMLLNKIAPSLDIEIVMIPHHRGYNHAPWEKMKESDLVFIVDFGSFLTYLDEDDFPPTFIVDHHSPEGQEIPKSPVILNPEIGDANPGLCAAGIMFALLNLEYGRGVWHTDAPWFAALGTLGDVAPVNQALNWALLKQIELLGKYPPRWLKLLTERETITIKMLSFYAVPRLNSLARMQQDPIVAVSHLLGWSENQKELTVINNARRDFVKAVQGFITSMNDKVQSIDEKTANILMFNFDKSLQEKLLTYLESQLAPDNPVWQIINSSDEGIAPLLQGVAGLIAGGLSGQYSRPVFVGVDVDGQYFASARSRNGHSILESINELKEKGLISIGGGHDFAGGITYDDTDAEDVRQFLANKSIIPGSESIYGPIGLTIPTKTPQMVIEKIAEAISKVRPLPNEVRIIVPIDVKSLVYTPPSRGENKPGFITDSSRFIRLPLWGDIRASMEEMKELAKNYPITAASLSVNYSPKYHRTFIDTTAFLFRKKQGDECLVLTTYQITRRTATDGDGSHG